MTLLHSVNYTWVKGEIGRAPGENLPEVDEFLDLMDLVGLPVVVKVENAINDGKDLVTSSICGWRRLRTAG